MPPKKRQPMPQDQQDVPARKPNRRRTAARRCHTIQPDSPTPLADTATSFADTADFETPAKEKTKRSLPTSPSSSASRPEPETRIPANKNKNESCLPTSEQPTPIPKITVELDTDKWMILNRHIRQKSGKEIPAAFVEDSNSDLYLEYYPRTVREYEIIWNQIIEDNCVTIGPPRWQPTTKPHNQPPKPTEPIEAISRRSPTPSMSANELCEELSDDSPTNTRPPTSMLPNNLRRKIWNMKRNIYLYLLKDEHICNKRLNLYSQKWGRIFMSSKQASSIKVD
ncbi:hypothetical protein ACJJTC_009515 [Scirpophaga incertulas]